MIIRSSFDTTPNQETEHSLPDIKYLAGFFDGDGCINIIKYHNKKNNHTGWNLRCSATNCFLSILDYYKTIFGGTIHIAHKATDKHRICFCWEVRCQGAKAFLLAVFPFLTVKKEEARVALRFMKTIKKRGTWNVHRPHNISSSIIKKRDQFKEQLSSLKHIGLVN